MMLHEDKQSFADIVRTVSRAYMIAPALIEKDYYVTLLLKALKDKIDGLLFKGGTSLSKCYKAIDRFSEDIDLTLDTAHFTQGKKRAANRAVLSVCDELGFAVNNREVAENHSHGYYNAYEIEYPILFPSDEIKPYVKVEMSFIQKAYPDEIMPADCYIGAWLVEKGNKEAAEEFGLLPFDIRVQSLTRTFIDKVFALCDYYLSADTERNSRHIYDLSRLLTKIDMNDEGLKPLIANVRANRKTNKTCVSAQDGVNVPILLHEIKEKEFFKKDYIDTTEKLLIKLVSYDEAIKALSVIIQSRLFE